MKSINIAREFSTLPGPRTRNEGPHSGEDFRERLLLPAFRAACAEGDSLTIELDGVEFGYPTSFLEEAFGGLVRAGYAPGVVRDHLTFVATEEPLLADEIRGYIMRATASTAMQTS